ncbi:MFS transporter [Actinoplanes sp. NPDC051470]|uniref:MFS transporter n=1 Tax=Actinoplanes sp. NPDC051470 TaxID=3157224 RepID=UPI00341D6FE9
MMVWSGMSALRLLQTTTFVSTLDRFAMPPMLVAMSGALGVPLSTMVHVAGFYFLAYGVMQPVWGVVSDRLGRVRTLRLSLVLAATASAASACVANTAQLGVARAIAGACFAAAIPAGLIYVGDTVPAERRQPSIAALMTGVAAGTALASATAGALASAVSWRLMFALSAACALVLVVLLRRLPPLPLPPDPEPLLAPAGRVARSPFTLLVLAIALVEGGILLGALTLLPAATEQAGAGPTLAGLVTAVYGVAVFAFARLVGRLSRTRPVWQLIAGGAAACALACGVAAVSRAPVAAAGAAVLLGMGWASMHSSLQTWATEVLPSARATAVSLFAGCLFAGSSVAAVLLAGPADAGRFDIVYAALAVACLPLGVLASVARARWRLPTPVLRPPAAP